MAPSDNRVIGYSLKNYILPETVKEISDFTFMVMIYPWVVPF